MENIVIHIEVVLKGTPKKQIIANGVVCRFGYQEIQGSGMYKCASVKYIKMPDVNILREVVERYNAEHGIPEQFNPSDYGYETL